MNTLTQYFKKQFILVILVILCASCSHSPEPVRPDLGGVWFIASYGPDDSRWRFEDVVCKGMCSKAGLEYLRALLDDPQNDDKPITAIFDELQAYDKSVAIELLTPSARAKLSGYDPESDPTVDCNPDGDGWLHQLLAPIPFKFEQFEDRVVIRYEYWNVVRTIYTDGRKPTQDAAPVRLGHSVGHYDGAAFVVETSGILPAIMMIHHNPPGLFLTHSSEVRTIERYTVSEDGNRLNLEWTMIDPENFRQPLVGQASFLLYLEKTELEEYICDSDETAEIY